jgi:hypothetical protein
MEKWLIMLIKQKKREPKREVNNSKCKLFKARLNKKDQ